MPLADALAIEVSAGSVALLACVLAVAVIVAGAVAGLLVRSAVGNNSARIDELQKSSEENGRLCRQTNTLIRVMAASQGHAAIPVED
jgi:hypothetical protein